MMYCMVIFFFFFFFSSRRRHTRSLRDWSSDVCSSDLAFEERERLGLQLEPRLGVGDQEPVRLEGVRADLLLRSEEHTSELQSRRDLVCRLLLEKKKKHRQ